jgi:hypothetical protein
MRVAGSREALSRVRFGDAPTKMVGVVDGAAFDAQTLGGVEEVELDFPNSI